MKDTSSPTKALAALGAFLAWLPIAFTLLTTVIGSLAAGFFRCDWLMPAELFPSAFAGGALLLWAAFRAGSRRRPIAWGCAAMLALLFGGQALAVVTGLASGETALTGWQWALVVSSLGGYTLALVVTGCGGLLLIRDLFRHEQGGPAMLPHA